MENKQFLSYLKNNMVKISLNFENVFSINFEEFSSLINTIIKDVTFDEFYNKLLKKKTQFNSFEESSLLEIKKVFINLGLGELEIKKIILTIPDVILFSDKIEDIYPIYKSNEFKGIAFVNDNEYRAYSYSESSYRLRYLNQILDSKTNNYDYIIESLLNSLKRKDVREELNIKSDNELDLKDKFTVLTRIYSKKNYYLKQKK